MRRSSLLLALSMTACSSTAPLGQTEGPLHRADVLHTEVTEAEHGMVASDSRLGSEVGARVLQSGGNAIDAAVATAFALAVVYPEAGNIGGGGFIVARMADGTTAALDFREKAPLAASRDMYLDASGKVTNRSLIGHLASGVPGSVAGLWAAHQRFGTRPWAELIAPAIVYAEQGFTVDEHFASVVKSYEGSLRQFPASAALFLPGGKPFAAGDTWKNPELANVLRRIAEEGPKGFYQGQTAQLIVDEMKRGGGIITLEDLKRYRPQWRDPVEFTYRGQRVISMPPASSGGLTLALMANIAEGYNLKRLGFQTPQSLHVLAEAARRAFADRNEFLGDADFVQIPRDRFLSESYAAQQRATIAADRATPSAQVRPGLSELLEASQTTHFSVVDAQGNAAALTTTLNELFGSSVTVAGAGFLLNDEMDDFTSKPGSPNMFGLVQGEANAIAPEKRMLSAMTPTIVLGRDGKPLLITGARGGPRIISAVHQILANVLDYDLSLAQALSAPRIHMQHLPDVLYYEKGLATETVRALQAMGYTVEERSGYIGAAPTILRHGRVWVGAADPRSGGGAVGY